MKNKGGRSTTIPADLSGYELTSRRFLADEALRSASGGAGAQRFKQLSTNHVRFDPYKTFNFR